MASSGPTTIPSSLAIAGRMPARASTSAAAFSDFQLPTFAAAFERQLQRQKLESKESVVIRC
jgi:hypothetical protein